MEVQVLFVLSVLSAAAATTVLTRHQEDDLLPSSAFQWRHVDIADTNYTVAVDPLEWNHYPSDKIRFVCRALHLGQWIPGYMQHGRCYVPWRRKEHGKKQYDVLIGVQGAGRTQWKEWKAGDQLPELAVTTGSYYISRHWDDILQRFVVGTLSMDGTKAKSFLRGKLDATLSTGDILTEMEPIRYELENLEAPMSNWVIEDTVPMELAKAELQNTQPTEQEIFKQVDFRFSESLVMDKLTGMKPGLIMTVKMFQTEDKDDGSTNTHLKEILDEHNFYVGVDLIHDHAEQDVLKAMVPAHSNVSVSLLANYKTYRIPYKATVKAFYEDGETIHWKGSGNIMFKRIEDLLQMVNGITSKTIPVQEDDFDGEESDSLEEDQLADLMMLEETATDATEVAMIAIREEEDFLQTTLVEETFEPAAATTEGDWHLHPEDSTAVKWPTEEEAQGTTMVVLEEAAERQWQTSAPATTDDIEQEPAQLQTEAPAPIEDQQQKKNGTLTTEGPKEEKPPVLSIYRRIGLPEPNKAQYKPPRSFLPMISLKEFFGQGS